MFASTGFATAPRSGLPLTRRHAALWLTGVASATLIFLNFPTAKGGKAAALLTAEEIRTLEAICDTLVPGAIQAGVGAFVNAMLSDSDRMLACELTGLPVAAIDFYPAALAALNRLAIQIGGAEMTALSLTDRQRVVDALLAPGTANWSGPPAALVYWAMRNDAVDAVYGVARGYDQLGVPYAEHIMPPRPW